jgi:hypothetical protein
MTQPGLVVHINILHTKSKLDTKFNRCFQSGTLNGLEELTFHGGKLRRSLPWTTLTLRKARFCDFYFPYIHADPLIFPRLKASRALRRPHLVGGHPKPSHRLYCAPEPRALEDPRFHNPPHCLAEYPYNWCVWFGGAQNPYGFPGADHSWWTLPWEIDHTCSNGSIKNLCYRGTEIVSVCLLLQWNVPTCYWRHNHWGTPIFVFIFFWKSPFSSS